MAYRFSHGSSEPWSYWISHISVRRTFADSDTFLVILFPNDRRRGYQIVFIPRRLFWLYCNSEICLPVVCLWRDFIFGHFTYLRKHSSTSFQIHHLHQTHFSVSFCLRFCSGQEGGSIDLHKEKEYIVTIQLAELLQHPAIENRFAMGRIPAGSAFSYGLYSECTDLAEL